MAGKFAGTASAALALVAQVGQPCTFTRTRRAVTPATGTPGSPQVTTIAGKAVRVRGNPQRYQALKLELETMPTLLFCPTAYGSAAPMPGDTTVWEGREWTARDVDPVSPDGTPIVCRVVVGR